MTEREDRLALAETNHLSVLIEAVGYENMRKVKTALHLAGYVIYKGDPSAALRSPVMEVTKDGRTYTWEVGKNGWDASDEMTREDI